MCLFSAVEDIPPARVYPVSSASTILRAEFSTLKLVVTWWCFNRRETIERSKEEEKKSQADKTQIQSNSFFIGSLE